jgi:hypothetical protein
MDVFSKVAFGGVGSMSALAHFADSVGTSPEVREVLLSDWVVSQFEFGDTAPKCGHFRGMVRLEIA